ncbi:MAG: DUF29 domain-containing protein [Microcystaceae cyanobacterium]
MTTKLYDTDFYAWTQQQASFLLTGQWQNLDINNLGEEIAALGKQQRQELRNRLGILIGHLLKWDYQPQLRGKSWKATIREQRDEILDIIDANPSLKPYLEEAIAKGFRQGINLVVKETPLDDPDLPKDCPYSQEQILDRLFPPTLEN